MTGHEFLKKLRRLGKERKVEVAFDPAHGKGSHGTVSFGTASTTIKDLKKEIGPGLLGSMCRDLGIRRTDL
jgi:mRNA interferase HicA